MNTNLKSLLGAACALLVALGSTHLAAAQATDERILFSHAISGEIYATNPDGSGTVQLTTGGGAWPAWSSDKRYILFHRSTYSENTIYIMEAVGHRNGGRIFPVASNGGNTGLDWAPDGGAIIYEGSSGGLYTVSVNADTGEVGEPVLLRDGPCAAPAWSSDGTKIAFTTPASLLVLDLITGAEVAFRGYGASFSPDGSQIAYLGVGPVTKRGKTTWYPQIFIANVDGTGITQLTAQAWDYINFPKWSPNGTEIAFWHRSNDLNSIRKFSLATGAISLVKKNGQTLDWAP